MFHLFCLLSVAFFMPLSVWLVSVFSMAMIINWLLGADFKAKLRIVLQRKELLLIPALFILYVLWLINTTNFHQSFLEFKLKLPLLLFPLFAGGYGTFTRDRLRMIMVSFIAGCTFAVVVGYAALAGFIPVMINDSRELALFVPSIRLSILLNLAIFSALFLGIEKETGKPLFRVLLLTTAVVMGIFLFRLLSVTGIIIFVLVSTGTAVYFITQKSSRLPGIIIASLALACAFIFLKGMSSAWSVLHNPENPEINIVIDKTPLGNQYKSLTDESLVENGYLVWNNVCEEELRAGWNKRSKLPYDGFDVAGNDLRMTLIRYISFLGMRKDSAAIEHLTSDDIKNIENGFANPLYADIGNPSAKWYEVAWQVDRYLKGGNPSGHSVTQRLEFYKTAFAIIGKHPFTGVGTGDVRNEFDIEYEAEHTPLSREFRLMAHNQYLTFAITFGIPGLILALFLMISPAIIARKRINYLFAVFLAIIFISMFNDDTFESAMGTTFFSYFYTLFLLTE